MVVSKLWFLQISRLRAIYNIGGAPNSLLDLENYFPPAI